MKHDVTQFQALVDADTKLLQKLNEECKRKQVEQAEHDKTRSEELGAIHETVKLLNDDDARDLFSATMSGAGALLQMDRDAKRLKAAASMLRSRWWSRSSR